MTAIKISCVVCLIATFLYYLLYSYFHDPISEPVGPYILFAYAAFVSLGFAGGFAASAALLRDKNGT